MAREREFKGVGTDFLYPAEGKNQNSSYKDEFIENVDPASNLPRMTNEKDILIDASLFVVGIGNANPLKPLGRYSRLQATGE